MSSRSNKDQQVAKEIPEIIVDPNTKVKYERGRFLGKVTHGFLLLRFVSMLEITIDTIIVMETLKSSNSTCPQSPVCKI